MVNTYRCVIIRQVKKITPDELSEPTATLENLSVSLADEDQAVEEINQCLVCHTNKQALVDTVSPLVVVMSESSGEG